MKIKKRKPGKCSWCGEAIPVGSVFVWWTSVNSDGVPNGSCSMHPECDEAYRLSYRETFHKGDFIRGKTWEKLVEGRRNKFTMNEPYCLAIDPGTEQSACVLMDKDLNIIHHNIVDNYNMLTKIDVCQNSRVICEEIESFGMPVGKEMFRTVRWIGRFEQLCHANSIPFELVSRKTIKAYWCGSTRATEANVWQAMVDLWGSPGTKKEPGKLYGIKSHERSALAIAGWRMGVLPA